MNELEKQNVILKGLLLFWDCCICEQLGWKKECMNNKDKCNYFVYDKLRDHIHAIDEIKAKAKRK